MIDCKRAQDVLSLFGEIQWRRFSLGPEPLDGLCRPPMLVWRYTEADAAVRERIRETVEGHESRIPWHHDLAGRNWSLLPLKLHESFRRAQPAYTDVLGDFRIAHQEYCVQASADLETLLNELEAAATAGAPKPGPRDS